MDSNSPCLKNVDVMDDQKSRSFGLPVIVGDEDDEFFDLRPFEPKEFPVRKNVLYNGHLTPDVAANCLKTAREKNLPIRRAVSDDLVIQSCKMKNDCQPSCSIFGSRGKVPPSVKGKSKDASGLCVKKCSPACCPGKYWDIVGDANNGKYGGASRGKLGAKYNSSGSFKSHHNPSSILPINTSDEESYGENFKGEVTIDVTAKTEETQHVHSPKRSATNRRLPHNDFVSTNGKSNKVSHEGETCSSLLGTCTSGDKKESNVRGILPVRAESIETIGSKTRKKKSVHSDDISTDNLRPPNNDMKDINVGNTMHNEFSVGNSSELTSIDNHGSRSCWLDGRKGKAIVKDEASQFANGTKDKSTSRNRFRPGKEAFNISSDSLISSIGSNFISEMEDANNESINILKKNIFSSKENMTGHLLNKRHETRRGDKDYINPLYKIRGVDFSHCEKNLNQAHQTSLPKKEARRCLRPQKQTKCERKGRLHDSQYGECSSFPNGDSEISCIQSTRQGSHLRRNRTRNIERRGSVFESVTEIDDRVSEGTYFSNSQAENFNAHHHLNTRIDQVESDEILARQLQEQLNLELSGFRGGNERDASMAHLYAHRRHAPLHSFSQRQHDQFLASRRMSQFRRNLNHDDMDMEMRTRSELRRRLTRAEMDLDMMNILETFEAALGNRENRVNPGGLFSAHRDFTGDDYEMLLALDDNIHRHGASENQINTLPQYVVQRNGSEEICTICLEVPSAGDVIRHLPCLHKFHKECIGTWLKTKASCPICKSDIT